MRAGLRWPEAEMEFCSIYLRPVPKLLIQFIGELGLWGERDEFLDYLCEVDLSGDEYEIRLYGFKKELQFRGTLDEFAKQYG
ncbi:MAG: hypothetical protein U9R60_03245 [Bacteroidota bacterium]|nr:hypothetical protein [Bacteroidota bacterium]